MSGLTFRNSLLVLAVLGALLTVRTADAQTIVPITIESTPPGATVYLNSTQAPPLGVTPLRNVRVPRGAATFIFKLENHEEARLPVTVYKRREIFRAVLAPLSTVVVSAANENANGAAVRIDGEPVGNVPMQTNVKPGRHLVQVGREGFKTFSQWIDIAGAQSITVPVILEKEAPRTGAVLVVGDSPGARIVIDGEPKGSTPQLIEGIPEGERVVEIIPQREDAESFKETVRVIAGERITLNPSLVRVPVKGSLRVFTNVKGALITVDGAPVGESPVTVDDLAPGEHLVEATADDHEDASGVVTVEAGRQAMLQLRLSPVTRAMGKIVVNADVAGSKVFVDNEERGDAPVVITDAEPGTHAIRVVAPGRQEFRTTCNIGPGQDCEINAMMAAEATPVRIEANIGNASFFMNDEYVGPVPWEGDLPTGSQKIEVRADNYRPHSEVVALKSSEETRVFNFTLVGEGQLTPEEERELERERQIAIRKAVSHGAAVLPEDLAVLDLGIGYLPLAKMRLGIGILPWLEAGFAFHTIGRLNQFDLSVKAGYQPIKQLSVAGRAILGGGIGPRRTSDVDTPTVDASGEQVGVAGSEFAGPHKTNAFYVGLEGIGSLHFSRAGAVSLWVALDMHSDRWQWSGTNRNALHVIETADGVELRNRQVLARARIGGSLELTVSKRMNFWGMFEGTLGPERRIYGNLFLNPDRRTGRADPQIYAMVGITLKFGSLWEEDELE
jgi:hypothetical protein